MFQPKGSLIFTVSSKTELYLSAGRGFHSDDVRGVTEAAQQGLAGAPLLARSTGEEVGVREEFLPNLSATLTAFQITFQSELTYDPDAGQTPPRPPRQSPPHPARVLAASSSNNNHGVLSSTVCIHMKPLPPSRPTAGASLKASNGGTQNKSNAPCVKPRPIGASHTVSMSIRNRTAVPMVHLTVIHPCHPLTTQSP